MVLTPTSTAATVLEPQVMMGMAAGLLVVVCVFGLMFCFQRCAETQRRALRDSDEDEAASKAHWRVKLLRMARTRYFHGRHRNSYTRVPAAEIFNADEKC